MKICCTRMLSIPTEEIWSRRNKNIQVHGPHIRMMWTLLFLRFACYKLNKTENRTAHVLESRLCFLFIQEWKKTYLNFLFNVHIDSFCQVSFAVQSHWTKIACGKCLNSGIDWLADRPSNDSSKFASDRGEFQFWIQYLRTKVCFAFIIGTGSLFSEI